MGFSRVGYSEEGVGLVKSNLLQSSGVYSARTRSKVNCFGSQNGKDCCGCGSNLKVKGGL